MYETMQKKNWCDWAVLKTKIYKNSITSKQPKSITNPNSKRYFKKEMVSNLKKKKLEEDQ